MLRDIDLTMPPQKDSKLAHVIIRNRSDPEMLVARWMYTGPRWAAFIPNTRSATNWEHGVCKRLLAQVGHMDIDLVNRFADFVENVYLKDFRPLPPDTDVSFETWMEDVDYDTRKRRVYTEAHEKYKNLDHCWHPKDRRDGQLRNKQFRLKSHIKLEKLMQLKYARIINARDIGYNQKVGPWLHALEKSEWHHVISGEYWRIFYKKGIEHSEFPKKFNEIFEDYDYLAETDYTSWENCQSTQLMDAFEFRYYKHMFSLIPGGHDIAHLIAMVQGGVNRGVSKWGKFMITGERMSGDMTTSHGNGSLNAAIVAFVAYLTKNFCVGIFEGDDGVVGGVDPKSMVSVTDKLGASIKLDVLPKHQVKFCSEYVTPDNNVLRDPIRVLRNIFWTISAQRDGGEDIMRGLLRACAYSVLYSNPGCPIISVLGEHLIKMTSGYDTIYDRKDMFWSIVQLSSSVLETAVRVEPTNMDRIIFSELFKISPELQIRVENYIRGASWGWWWDFPLTADDDTLRAFDQYRSSVHNASHQR